MRVQAGERAARQLEAQRAAAEQQLSAAEARVADLQDRLRAAEPSVSDSQPRPPAMAAPGAVPCTATDIRRKRFDCAGQAACVGRCIRIRQDGNTSCSVATCKSW